MSEATESVPNASLHFSALDERLAVCRLGPRAEIPAWATAATFFSLTRTADELSIVCPERNVPAGVVYEGGWRALKLEGPFDFGLVGVLASVAVPLAESEVGIFAIATYDTNYVLVVEFQLGLAMSVLSERGHHEIR